MSQPIIAIEHASKSYRKGQQLALNDVSLQIAPATFVAVVGASGSGKTTLLKSMNRLAQLDAGTVRVSGDAVSSVPEHELRRRMGYVFQGIGLFPHLTVAENIGITPRLLGWDTATIAARVAELADLVALPRNYLERLPAELSGGQRQRVGVARALAARPAILLMDEPFGALDPITRDALGTQVRSLHDALKLTTVMITHDVLEAVLLADRIIVMRAGRIVADDVPHVLLAGHPDEEVRALMEMPRRQAARVRAVLESTARG
jgi:osmoprotectant transport system ATP-binding protein